MTRFRKKKSMYVDQKLVDRVRRYYKVQTETEAVTRALGEAAYQEKGARWIRALLRKRRREIGKSV